MTRTSNPAEAVTSAQWDAAVQAEADRTAPHGFDWRRAYSAAEQAEREDDDAAFAAEWTAEVTAARRAAWNALVRSGALTGRDGTVSARRLSDQERAQGWTVDDLKAAVQMHGL